MNTTKVLGFMLVIASPLFWKFAGVDGLVALCTFSYGCSIVMSTDKQLSDDDDDDDDE